jgi:hypothetical protein
MTLYRELDYRLRRSVGWVAAQFWLTLLLILLGLAWTRLPDKHAWQVAITLIVPLLLAISLFELEAGTMRALADDDGRRVKLVYGALTLLVWFAVGWLCWAILDWCDERIPVWAGYLNSRASAHGRATFFTYAHIQKWLILVEWVLRWIVVPGKLLCLGTASAQWGWRLPWRRLIRMVLNWRQWLGVVLAALVGVALPSLFFAGIPHGTVSEQVWAVGFKLAGAYLLAVGSWVLLLGWIAALMSRTAPRTNPPDDESLVAVPAAPGPPRGSDSVRLPLPEGGNDSAGNA